MMQPILTILYPIERRKSFVVPEGVSVVGRGLDADIRLDDELVSRKHLEISRSGLSLRVRDLGSRNGTFHEGMEISEALLTGASRLQLGATILKLEFSEEEDSSRDSNLNRLMSFQSFQECGENICAFAIRNALPLALLSIEISAGKNFNVEALHQKIEALIGLEKRTFDLFSRAQAFSSNSSASIENDFSQEEKREKNFDDKNDSEISLSKTLRYFLLMPNVSTESLDEIEKNIRQSIFSHRFVWRDDRIDLKLSFGRAYRNLPAEGDFSSMLTEAGKRIC